MREITDGLYIDGNDQVKRKNLMMYWGRGPGIAGAMPLDMSS